MEVDNKAEAKATKSPGLNDKDKPHESCRFHLQLTGSSDRSFPEFSYLELLGNTKKNKKKDEDVFQQDDDCNMDELRALAKKFEEKYAPKVAVKSKKAQKTDRVQDLVDVTYGYDITDAFVDDSEAYDELVPADWTTEHGGFYINMGELNFRPLASSDDKSSDNDFKDAKKKTQKKIKEHKEKKIKEGKRCLSSGEKEKSVVKKIKLSGEDKETTKLKKSVSPDGQSNGQSNGPMDVAVAAGIHVTPDKHLLTHNASELDNTTSSIPLNLQTPVIKLEKNYISDIVNSTSSTPSGIHMTSSYSVNENDNNSTVPGSASLILPEGLPPSLILSIQKLIEAARKAGGDGKCKFFNMDVNRILLQIETDSRKLNCRARSAVYDSLALFLPCTKETLLKRAKNLFMQEQVGRLREPLTTLRHAVEAAMPGQIKHYEEEMAKHSEDQATQGQKPCSDVVSQNGEKKDEASAKVIEMDGEIDKTEEATTPIDVNAPTTPVEEKGKRSIVPKRFVWKEDIRNILCDVVKIKVELYLMSKSRSTTAEEALKGFLETEVRPIWPKGWMTTRILYRESKQAHAKATSTLIAKAKKVNLKKPKDDEGSEVETKSQPQVTVEPNLKTVGENKKPENEATVTAVSIPNGTVSSAAKPKVVQQNLGNPSLNQTQAVTCNASLSNTTKLKVVQQNVTNPSINQTQTTTCIASLSNTTKPNVVVQILGNPSLNQTQTTTCIASLSNTTKPKVVQQNLGNHSLNQAQAINCMSSFSNTTKPKVLQQNLGNPSLNQAQAINCMSSLSNTTKPNVLQQNLGNPSLNQAQAISCMSSLSNTTKPNVLQQNLGNPSLNQAQTINCMSSFSNTTKPKVVQQNLGNPSLNQAQAINCMSSFSNTTKPKVLQQNLGNPSLNQAQAISCMSSLSNTTKPKVLQQNLGSPSLNKPQAITCMSSLSNSTTKPKVTGKSILDLLESSPGRNTQTKNNTIESKLVVNQIKKMAVVSGATNIFPSCSFQGLSSKQLAQISPPRTIKSPISIQNSSPRSSPNRIPAINLASVRQMSTIPGNFKPIGPVPTKRLPSCSLMSSPTLPTQSKPEAPPSPVSPRQNYSYINQLPSSPSLGYPLSTNFMDLASPAKSIPPLTPTSLLNSMAARSSVPQNHISSNSPLLRPSALPNPLNDLAATLNTIPHNIPSIIGMPNNLMPNNVISNNGIQNKTLKVHGVFPSGLSNVSGLQQFANQPVVHRITTTKELKEGNNTQPSYPPTYRPPFS